MSEFQLGKGTCELERASRWEGEWRQAHTAHFYAKDMATVVCLFPITIYQITGLILWWDAEECKEVQLTFFKTQLHLSECEPDLQVNGFFKLKN